MLINTLNLTLKVSNGEFLVLRLESPTGGPGRAIVGDVIFPFGGDDTTVLLPLPAAPRNEVTSIHLESAAPARLVGLDLLSYESRSINLDITTAKPLLDQFGQVFRQIAEHLDAVLADNGELRTAVIFGANAVGGKIRDMAEAKGLSVIGFVDNYIRYFELAEVHEPKEIEKLRPDVVLITSKVHAQEMAVQVRQVTSYGPTIITGE